MNKKKFHLAGEVALLIVLLINSLGVDLMSKSGFGISTISSVPLVFNIAFPVFSFGTWNYIFQTLLVITLMILKRSFCPGYLFSFVVGIGFGKMIDVHNAWIQALPNSLPLHTIYFLAGFFFYQYTGLGSIAVSALPTTVCFQSSRQISSLAICPVL